MVAHPSIWVVDDDLDDQMLLQYAFSRLAPPKLIKALDDGHELVSELEETTVLPKLILLDLNMPRLNGFDTLKIVRRQPAYSQLPIVVLTTSSASEDQYQAVELGASGFLIKPATYQKLEEMARQLANEWSL